MINNCLILSGGEFSVPEMDFSSFDYIISCDKGYEYCQKLSLVPDVILGDFDSSPYPETEIPILKFPTRKDDTDTMLAIRHALDLKVKNITLLCALGKRLDHTYANIQSCVYAETHGCKIQMVSSDTSVSFLNGETVKYKNHPGWSFSCFAVTDICKGVTIEGAKFNVHNVEIPSFFPLGVSNTWEEDAITISNTSGILMVMESRLDKGEHI